MIADQGQSNSVEVDTAFLRTKRAMLKGGEMVRSVLPFFGILLQQPELLRFSDHISKMGGEKKTKGEDIKTEPGHIHVRRLTVQLQ